MESPFEKYYNFLCKYIHHDNVIELQQKWNEPHRFWHNEKHLIHLLYRIEENKNIFFKDINYDVAVLSAFYHDAYYNPKSNNNEELSIDFMKNHLKYSKDNETISKVQQLIELTSKRKEPSINEYGFMFWFYDNEIIFSNDFSELLNWEEKIFKEFQYLSWKDYQKGRISFLKDCLKNLSFKGETNTFNSLIKYVETRKPKIGVYAGSFNPWHIGHQNILEKSEKIFDKVIIAYGNNPDKKQRQYKSIPNSLQYKQVEFYDGLLTDYITSLEEDGCDITLIRGLRNGNDLDYESNTLQYLKDYKQDIKIIMILCDKEYEHISSSTIKNLSKFNIDITKYLL
jgi:pantetheine-phosphate adenylyltransferase